MTAEGRRGRVSLRKAIAALPDDRDTAVAVHEVVAYLEAHKGERLDACLIGRATGLASPRVEPVLDALSDALVIDCDGDPRLRPCSFSPDPVLKLEVDRYLRSAGAPREHLRRAAVRFRGRGGTSLY